MELRERAAEQRNRIELMAKAEQFASQFIVEAKILCKLLENSIIAQRIRCDERKKIK